MNPIMQPHDANFPLPLKRKHTINPKKQQIINYVRSLRAQDRDKP